MLLFQNAFGNHLLGFYVEIFIFLALNAGFGGDLARLERAHQRLALPAQYF